MGQVWIYFDLRFRGVEITCGGHRFWHMMMWVLSGLDRHPVEVYRCPGFKEGPKLVAMPPVGIFPMWLYLVCLSISWN